jgi:hypothetical protein
MVQPSYGVSMRKTYSKPTFAKSKVNLQAVTAALATTGQAID